MISYKVGQLVKHPFRKLVRKVTRVSKGKVFWELKDGTKGKCNSETMRKWELGFN